MPAPRTPKAHAPRVSARNKSAGKPAARPKAAARPAPRPAAPTSTAAGTSPGSPLDPALVAEYQAVLARLREARSGEARTWDDQFEALDVIANSEPPLYLAGGYPSLRAFLAAELPALDERTARRWMRVARWFDPADEERHSVTKLDALLVYLEAAGGAPVAPAKIHLDRQKVRVVRGKSSRLVPFAEVSIDELRTAARAAQEPSALPATLPPAVKVIKQHLATARLGTVGVRLRGGKLDLSGIPLDRLPDLLKALSAVRLPPA